MAARTGPLSRRDTLRLSAGAGVAALLAACGGGGGAGSAGTPAAGTAAPNGAAAITIPTTGAVLPTDNVSFHWIDSGGLKQTFMQQFVPLYEKAHPNITVQYDALPWNEIAKTVPLGVQNGNAPDVFQLPMNFTGGQAVAQGWIQPLDAIIPNFAQWKAGFPPGIFYEGVTVYQGRTYSFPFWSNKTGDLLLYNVDYLTPAGIDPQSKPMTWDEYRAVAKKLTQQGSGKYYGVIIEGNQADRWAAHVRTFAQPAGAIGASAGGSIQDMNLKTGEFNFASDQYLAAIDLLLALKVDGSVFPGSLSLNGPQARAQMAQGVAGMILQGPFNIPQWKTENPDFHFGVARTPVPNNAAPVPQMYTPGGGEFFWVYAKSEHPAIAGDIFSYFGSAAGQTAALSITGGARQSVFAQANAAAQLDPRAKQANDIFDQTLHLGPDPNVRNPEWAHVELERKTVTPDFGTTIQGIYTGHISNAKQAMLDLKDRADKELDRAIKAAQAKGASVSRDDLVFPNWDPTKDYTDGDYAALKK